MYNLKHAGIIANKLLPQRLPKHGYYQTRTPTGLWKHKWRPMMFSKIVETVGVKYLCVQHAIHLFNTIRKYYEISEDWEGA